MGCGMMASELWESTLSRTTYVKFSQVGQDLERIIWEQGGSVSKSQTNEHVLVSFPENTVKCFLYEDECPRHIGDSEMLIPHYPNKWIYRVPTKDKYIWLIAVSMSRGDPPVLARTTSPWNESFTFLPEK